MWSVVLRLAPGSAVPNLTWSRALDAEAGGRLQRPRPELVSPTHMPGEAWKELPVPYTWSRPWGVLVVQHLNGDAAERLRTVIVRPRSAR